MADIQFIGDASASRSPTSVDRFIRRAGLTLVGWANRREILRSRRLAALLERLGDPNRDARMLDPDAPRAVRQFGFAPGAFK